MLEQSRDVLHFSSWHSISVQHLYLRFMAPHDDSNCDCNSTWARIAAPVDVPSVPPFSIITIHQYLVWSSEISGSEIFSREERIQSWVFLTWASECSNHWATEQKTFSRGRALKRGCTGFCVLCTSCSFKCATGSGLGRSSARGAGRQMCSCDIDTEPLNPVSVEVSSGSA